MVDTQSDADLGGPIPDEDDPRSDIEQAVQSRADAADAASGGSKSSPLEPTGAKDGVSGTAGEVKNQDTAQQ